MIIQNNIGHRVWKKEREREREKERERERERKREKESSFKITRRSRGRKF